MATKPTMADVSRHCGLSVWTVSQALNGRPGVAEASRIAVKEAADELGYVVNTAASALKRNRRSGVSVITASTENAYYTDLVQGIHAELAEIGGLGAERRRTGGVAGQAFGGAYQG